MFEANPGGGGLLPPHRMTMRVLDALGNPVAGATFAAQYLWVEEGTGKKPMTDDRGVATLLFRFPLDASTSVSNLWLSVGHSNHPVRSIEWTAPAEQFLGLIPTNYTVRFAAMGPIGGIVRDAANRPVPGAKVQAWAVGRSRREDTASPTREYSGYYPGTNAPVLTDTSGAWTVSDFPVDADTLRVVITRADGSSAGFSSAGDTNDIPVELAALRRNQAVMILPEGNTVRGIVVDTSGQPIPGARLQESNWRTSSAYVFTNGADGRFVLPHRTASQLQLAIDSPQHLYLYTNFTHQAGIPELRFVLEPARIQLLAITVLDATNQPVAGARFWSPHLSSLHAGEPAVTDAEGRATLAFRFPRNSAQFPSEVRLTASHSNHFQRVVVWSAPPDQFATMVPTNDTIHFAAQETLGGYIRDDSGRPVAGARIDFRTWTHQSGSRNEASRREFTEFFQSFGILTDTNGFWSSARVPVDVGSLEIVVKRQGGAVTSFGGLDEAAVALDLAALRRTNAVLNLPATFTVRGIVVDENGQPVGGIGLRYGTKRWETVSTTNRFDGRFELPHQSGRPLWLSVETRQFNYYSTNFTVDISTPEVRLVLPNRLAVRQHSMTVMVLDPEGQPVEGASFFGDLRSGNAGNPITDARGMARLTFQTSDEWPLGSRSINTTTKPSGEVVTISRSTLHISIRHSNYVQRAIIWTAPTEKLLSSLPTNYTVRFPSLITIGGYVRDERAQPVAGARLDIRNTGTSSRDDDNTVRTNEVSEFYLTDGAAPISDTNGFWSLPRFPADLADLYFVVVRPGGAASTFMSGPNAGDASVDIAMLRRKEAVLTLSEGFTLRGKIVDDAGQPVSTVRLRERSRVTGGFYIFTNGADGRFELTHRSTTGVQLSVDSPWHAMLSTNIFFEPEAEARLVLSKQRPLRLRIIDNNGKPVQRAQVQPLEWRNSGLNYEWTGSTDADGRVTWSNAPAGSVVVTLSVMNAPSRRLRLSPGNEEVVIRVDQKAPESAVLRIKVIEAGTEKPVPGATVLRTVGYGREMAEVGKAGPDGRFEATLGVGNGGDRDRPFNVLVRGEGYLQWLCPEPFAIAEGNIELTAPLKKGRAAGVVLDPDGRPASGATVILNRPGNSVYSPRSGEFRASNSQDSTKTLGADGKFEFPLADGMDRLLAVHRSGFAELSVETLGDAGKINLQRWGRVEGVVKSGGKALARQQVGLRTPLYQASGDGHSFQYYSTTDRSGRFVFTNIPPGEHLLVRHIGSQQAGSVDSHRLPVSVGPGETRQVSYEFGGRNVVGFVDADGDVDWMRDTHVLEAKVGRQPPGPEYSGMMGPLNYAHIRRAHLRSPAVLEYERKRQTLQLTFDRDGAFRIEDVPPGTYELRLRATDRSPRQDPAGRRVEPIEVATLVREIVIPPGTAGSEVDLGTIPVQTKVPTSPQTKPPPLSFRATTGNGRPYELSRERGRPALVVFWADWAPRSNTRLAELSTAISKQVTGTNNALISVCLDDDPGPARQAAQRLGLGWTHVHLAGPARFQITDQLGIDTLPVAFLLDADGLVIARDPGGRRAAAVLNRLHSQATRASSRP